MKYNLERIGKRLKKERKEAGLKSHDDLANYIVSKCYRSYSRQTIAKWEKGETMPPLEVLLALCEKYSCELGYLLCEYDTKTRVASEIAAETGLSEKAIDCLREWKNQSEIPVSTYNEKAKSIKESAIRFLNVINLLFDQHDTYNGFDKETHHHAYLFNLIHKFLYSHFTQIEAYDEDMEFTGMIKDWNFVISTDSDQLLDEFDISSIEKQVALNNITRELEELYSWVHSQK